jgi:hypothetical protein
MFGSLGFASTLSTAEVELRQAAQNETPKSNAGNLILT